MENKLWDKIWEPIREGEEAWERRSVLEQMKDWIGNQETWIILSAPPCIFWVILGKTMAFVGLYFSPSRTSCWGAITTFTTPKPHLHCYLLTTFIKSTLLYVCMVTHWGRKWVFIILFVVFCHNLYVSQNKHIYLERKLFH